MNEQALRFRLGLFVLGALVLLALLIVLFGGFPSLLKSVDRYTIVFENASGVGAGTPVRRSGVRVGEVESVALDYEAGHARVTIKVESGFPVRKNDRPTIVRGLLGSDGSIDFITRKAEPGPPADLTPVEVGATLQGLTQADTGEVLQKTTELVQPAQHALAELRGTLARFEKTAGVLEETLREYRELGQRARELPADLQKSSVQFCQLAQSLEEAVPDLRKLAQSTDAAVPDVRKVLRSLDEMTPQLKRTAAWMERTAGDWSKVGERAHVFLRDNEARLSDSIQQFHKLVNEENRQRLSNILAQVETGTAQMNNVLTQENVRKINEIVANVERSSKQFDGLMQDGRVAMRRVGETMTRAESVMQDVQKATEPVAQRSSGILKNLDDASNNFNQLVTEARDLMKQIVRTDGTVQRLLCDPSIYHNIEETVCGLNRLMPRLDRILRDTETFADKIARRPESLGLGGVFNPSSGLKEAPSTLVPHPPGPYIPSWRRQHP